MFLEVHDPPFFDQQIKQLQKLIPKKYEKCDHHGPSASSARTDTPSVARNGGSSGRTTHPSPGGKHEALRGPSRTRVAL